MDYTTFNTLTGVTLSLTDQSRFTTIEDVATKELERLLGYPLDPTDWANLYNETGKTQTDFICPDADNTLDSPDVVVGKYRLFDYHPSDRYLSIDPATAIHKVKLVREDITYKTFDVSNGEETDDISIKWKMVSVTGTTESKITQYLDLENCLSLTGWRNPCWYSPKWVQLAVDADWAFTTLPRDLEIILAKMIADNFQEFGRDDLQSETRGSHSYTRREPQTVMDKYPALKEYAGPNGTAKQRVL